MVRSHRTVVSLLALAGTVLLHALVLLPFVVDLSLPTHRAPDPSGAGASALVSPSEPTITAFFINEVSTVQRTEPPEMKDLASRGLAPADLQVVVLSPDPWPAALTDADESKDNAASAVAASDRAQHALLYGRYLGQVQARIERAWMRPRSEIGAPTFSCTARIEQNRQGDVIGIGRVLGLGAGAHRRTAAAKGSAAAATG